MPRGRKQAYAKVALPAVTAERCPFFSVKFRI
jgi:hypothetical protein